VKSLEDKMSANDYKPSEYERYQDEQNLVQLEKNKQDYIDNPDQFQK